MLQCGIDHVVMTAPTLAAGVESVRQALGVTPEPGGEHPRMGTHNMLLRLGEASYLEIIAVNPAAPRPDRARWFNLDRMAADATPRLATWVARTNDIEAAVAALPMPVGRIERMSRGPLEWLITIPADGGLPEDGIAPTLIQWLSEPHPASTLQELGLSLLRLEGFHPDPERIACMLKAVGFEGEFSVSPLAFRDQPQLIAHIRTPRGVRQLCAA